MKKFLKVVGLTSETEKKVYFPIWTGSDDPPPGAISLENAAQIMEKRFEVVHPDRYIVRAPGVDHKVALVELDSGWLVVKTSTAKIIASAEGDDSGFTGPISINKLYEILKDQQEMKEAESPGSTFDRPIDCLAKLKLGDAYGRRVPILVQNPDRFIEQMFLHPSTFDFHPGQILWLGWTKDSNLTLWPLDGRRLVPTFFDKEIGFSREQQLVLQMAGLSLVESASTSIELCSKSYYNSLASKEQAEKIRIAVAQLLRLIRIQAGLQDHPMNPRSERIQGSHAMSTLMLIGSTWARNRSYCWKEFFSQAVPHSMMDLVKIFPQDPREETSTDQQTDDARPIRAR